MQELSARSPDGELVWGRLWPADGEDDRPLVLLGHGLASSSVEWYDFPAALSSRGFHVAAFDFRGHGRSEGQRGVQSIDRARQDLEAVIAATSEALAGRAAGPIGLVGHSLGAALFLSCAPDMMRVAALVALAPPARLARELNPFERIGYMLADKVNRPVGLWSKNGLYVPYNVEYDRLYTSHESIKRAERDDFLQTRLPVRNYQTLLKQLDPVAAAKRLDKPTLVVLAERDLVVGPWNTRSVYRALATDSKRIVSLARSGHSMAGDLESARVVDLVADWMHEHLDGAEA